MPTNRTPTDEELFSGYGENGDMEAFGLLYDRYSRGIFRFLWGLVRETAAAEDLVQQTFLKAHEARASFDPHKSFRTWIFTIARRAAINWREREGHRDHPEVPESVSDPSPTPEALAIARQEAAVVGQALSSLSGEDAEAILLFKYEGLSYEEIGKVVGCSGNAAKMRVHRALRRLFDKLPAMTRPGRRPG